MLGVLETGDVALARAIITVPINPEFGSLNLAQAVILCSYEWSKHVGLEQPTIEELLPPAPQDDLEGMIGHFEALLETRDYFFPASRAAATRRTLRNMLTKPGWNHLEVRTMRVRIAASAPPMVTAGSTRCSMVPEPDTGSTPSLIAKNRISTGPSAKLGNDNPRRLTNPTTWSVRWLRLLADTTPAGMDTASAIARQSVAESERKPE